VIRETKNAKEKDPMHQNSGGGGVKGKVKGNTNVRRRGNQKHAMNPLPLSGPRRSAKQNLGALIHGATQGKGGTGFPGKETRWKKGFRCQRSFGESEGSISPRRVSLIGRVPSSA